MNEEHMRSIVAFSDADTDLIEEFKNLPNWELKQGDIPGSYPYLLQKGDVKIYLDNTAKNVVKTVNVLPQDQTENHPSFHNDVLQELAKDLQEKSIEHVLRISDSDKSKL
ncbi:hypothetical protein [Aeromonas dhakensis]|uniref:hypothetical protein n=1 Tax=Aeromonas dhakensis TaxID=196024 RepID=UPI00191DB42F|nr:hypothetical protein [Aeromonas dhakensis]MBL0676489.1 hypothetical protein [Aeromonas dhakensis]MDX7740364.1 hypothetical protein [Aeromonas dhakensis]WAG01142.1 hypothetical protein NRZ31_10440 [Aeromonas dhakensis]